MNRDAARAAHTVQCNQLTPRSVKAFDRFSHDVDGAEHIRPAPTEALTSTIHKLEKTMRTQGPVFERYKYTSAVLLLNAITTAALLLFLVGLGNPLPGSPRRKTSCSPSSLIYSL